MEATRKVGQSFEHSASKISKKGHSLFPRSEESEDMFPVAHPGTSGWARPEGGGGCSTVMEDEVLHSTKKGGVISGCQPLEMGVKDADNKDQKCTFSRGDEEQKRGNKRKVPRTCRGPNQKVPNKRALLRSLKRKKNRGKDFWTQSSSPERTENDSGEGVFQDGRQFQRDAGRTYSRGGRNCMSVGVIPRQKRSPI